MLLLFYDNMTAEAELATDLPVFQRFRTCIHYSIMSDTCSSTKRLIQGFLSGMFSKTSNAERSIGASMAKFFGSW
jgi:hypothetical protein